MDNQLDKDKRIKFLEDAIRRLLKERSEWETKARLLEDKMKAQEISFNKTAEEFHKESYFLKQVGTLIRPLFHDIKGQLPSLEITLQKAINYLVKINPESDLSDIINLLNSSATLIERLRRSMEDLTYLGGKAPDTFTRVEVNELIKENVRFILSLHSNISIDLNLYSKPIKILGDKDSLNQIITNLVINAVQACEPSKRRITLTTKMSEYDPKFMQVIVEDNGIGIYPSEINKIYDLHYTTKKTGFGIGLYLVKKAVGLHKGKIECESTPNEGATFVVSLPILLEEINDKTENASCG